MRKSPKSYLLQSRLRLLCIIITIIPLNSNSQIANLVSNGGFELVDSIRNFGNSNCATYWQPIDTNNYCYHLYSTSPSYSLPLAPYISTGFQHPRSGKNLALSSFYCDTSICQLPVNRGYPRNRLKKELDQGKTYCIKYFIVNANKSSVGIDGFGAYLADSTLDTISYCAVPLIYLTPQIQASNIFTDTLLWTAVSGTFTAPGSIKYLVLGNFKSDLTTNTLIIDPSFLPAKFNNIYIDDVSVLDIDLPAYAGPDKPFIAGDSVYIGRESDVEIDESCIWYQMTSPTTSITIDTIAGIWVKPVTTSTYVVRQQLWCSGVKWDTVVVFMDAVGISETGAYQNHIKIFPNPASNFIEVEYSFDTTNSFNEVLFYNQLGELVLRDSPAIKNKKSTISISKLVPGVYSIEFKEVSGHTVRKRLIVSR